MVNIIGIPSQYSISRSSIWQCSKYIFIYWIYQTLKFFLFRKVTKNHPIWIYIKPIGMIFTKSKLIVFNKPCSPCWIYQYRTILHLSHNPHMSSFTNFIIIIFWYPTHHITLHPYWLTQTIKQLAICSTYTFFIIIALICCIYTIRGIICYIFTYPIVYRTRLLPLCFTIFC